MFQAGDYVVCGDNGLCRIEQIGVPDFDTFERNKAYYFLRSEEDGSRIYVPINTHMPLRAPITQQEAEALLSSLPDLQVNPPSCRDRKALQRYYQELMHLHTCEALAISVKSIYSRHIKTPGRMSGTEEAILRKAEHQLCSELAAALSISYDSARSRMLDALRTADRQDAQQHS